MRFHVQPRDVPLDVAARRMGLTPAAFAELLPALYKAGFPVPDPVTGNFDLLGIERYCDLRHPQHFTSGVDSNGAVTDNEVFMRRIKEWAESEEPPRRRRRK